MPQPRVELEIGLGAESWGKIVIELDEEKAPITVKNFLKYVDDKFFDGTIFHRVIPNFMIQAGGYSGINQNKSPTQPAIKNEAANGLTNLKGTIAMARTNDPHSATAQFFINCSDNHFLNHPGHDGWGYCVFGKVTDGLDVVDRVRNVDTKMNPQMGEDSQPVNPPVIKSARRA
ncbi:MAG: peptidylprolyl isomerase [Phycisphaerae bacterium]